ncbi:alpha/beta hydrolase family protein [Rhodococcus sp. IEGM 1379]|uniref:alpha/beta hydrolase family protein n=1 Tax=Rhodococcus sp. IEGM 1379 TaxID=3047086 RepID=UPI0024B6AAAB|nr:alpha/beta hydrolase family protein [Rhodococcus sp. IEGM 1379]MDI9917073.1 alpha/beta hydrolase family protein [Rhodococcus sp. IEGM 1379]
MIPIETQLATWFGPATTPLLGFVHVPQSGTAREAVVLCSPIGKEHIDTYRGMRLLANELATRGIVAFRFDYEAIGDSTGAEDAPDAMHRWQDSIVSAIDYVRRSGAQSVSIVGLRLGALLAASALTECGAINSIVLWDPIINGRNYVREQRAFYAISVGKDDPADPRVSIMGGTLAPECADELMTSRINGPFPGNPRALLAVRSSMRDSSAITRLTSTIQPDVLVLENHETFTSPPSFYVDIPYGYIDEIADWIDKNTPEASHAFVPTIVPTARVAVTASGEDVYESLERVGAHQLFAIRTHPVSPATESALEAQPVAFQKPGRGLVFFTTAIEHRIGPGRSWVKIAREAAEHSVTTLRFDRRGVGDTGRIDVNNPTSVYSLSADDDAMTAVTALGASPENLILAGLCSGGWTAASVALKVGARSTILVNMILWSVRRKRALTDAVLPESPKISPEGGTTKLSFRVKIKAHLQARLPYFAWKILGNNGITQVPEVMLDALYRRGVHTKAILSPADAEWFQYQRGPQGIERMIRRGYTFDVVMPNVGDHPSYHRDLRSIIHRESISAITTQFGSSTGRSISSADAKRTTV